MTILQIAGVLLLGVILLAVGITKKKKWVLFASAIPLLIALWQIILLFGFALH